MESKSIPTQSKTKVVKGNQPLLLNENPRRGTIASDALFAQLHILNNCVYAVRVALGKIAQLTIAQLTIAQFSCTPDALAQISSLIII